MSSLFQSGLTDGLLGGSASRQRQYDYHARAQQAAWLARQGLYGGGRGITRPDPMYPEIKIKPTIEAGDPVIDVLQFETDEWLEGIL